MMGNKYKSFTKELKAIDEKDIRERIYSDFGSKHRIKRSKIIIEEIKEISKDEVNDPIIKSLI